MKKLVKEKVLPDGISILNLDGVGFGSQPYMIEGNGLLRKVKTSEKLNRTLAGSLERMKLKPEFWWAPIARHDHLPLLKAGFEATTLTFDKPDGKGMWLWRIFRLRKARDRIYPHLHTKDDLPDRLDPKTVEQAGRIVLDFLTHF
jgi:hypothetical protein